MTKDMTKCQDRSIYLSSQGHRNCLIGNCEAVNTKQSQTRYYGCGETAHSMELHGMISEGELQHNVVAFNTETVVTGTKQILKLTEIKTSPSNIPDVSSPKTSHDLSYEFPQSHGQSRLISSRQDQREFIKELSKNPETQTFVPLAPVGNIDIEKLKTEMVQKLQEIASDMNQSEQFAEKEIPSKLKSLKTILSVMKTQDLQQMYQKLQSSSSSSQEQKDTARTLYIEIVRNAGTSPCVMFLKQMIEQDQMSEIEKFLVVSTFSHYIKTPTEDLIHQIFQLIKSSAITSKPYLKAPVQYKVTAEDILTVKHEFPPKAGEKLRLEKVLAVGGKDFTLFGQPLLSREVVKVEATVVEKTLSPTRIWFMYIKRRGYFNIFRLFKEQQTMLVINSIQMAQLPETQEEEEPQAISQ